MKARLIAVVVLLLVALVVLTSVETGEDGKLRRYTNSYPLHIIN